MVLGIRSKSRKTVSIQVHYIIHVHEIRPWPPSKSLRSAQSVVLQWENGDKNSGSFACSSGDGKIEINESFGLPLLLLRESSKRGKHHDTFQKNFLDFYLYEHQNDKAKSQLLGSATINIADYGIIKEITAINTQLNCKKSFRNAAHPFLYINIQPFDVEGSDSSPKSSMSKELLLDKEESESATQSLNDEDVEIASFTDDEINDISSNTSQTIKSASETAGGLPPLDKVEIRKVGTMGSTSESIEPMETSSAGSHIETENGASLHSSSLVLSSDTSITTCDGISLPTFPADHAKVANARSKVLESANPDIKAEAGSSKKFNGIKLPSPSVTLSSDTGNATYDRPPPKFSEEHIKVSDVSSNVPNFSSSLIKEVGASEKSNGIKLPSLSMVLSLNSSNAIYDSYSSPKFPAECVKDADASCKIPESTQQTSRKNISKGAMIKSISSASYVMQSSIKNSSRSQDKELLRNPSEDDYPRNGNIAGATRPLSREAHEQTRNVVINDQPEDLTSLKLPLDISKNYGLFGNNQAPDKEEENNTLNDDHVDAACHEGSNTNDSLNNSETELKSEVQMLREELREAAALEIALYSVVADHGSSANKVHAPARRISRFYIHAFRVGSPAARASAAQSAVSGFVLVSKACGNDVPRLTFWLSNLILLRAIVSKGVEKIRLDDSLCINSDRNGSVNGSSQKRSPSSSDGKRENAVKHFHSWEDPQTFLFALEKIEAWIFSRIVESVWWQTLTPHMQSAVAKSSSSRKVYGRRHGLGDQEQGNFSIDLWKRSFKDACERLCPLRVGGHVCGCLPVIARLVMEQLVIRLDVAMFNAILRESAEEMPTDPISDPISDSRVLPIPAGKSGFGAGAQLKNAIGNWSRWLSDLFDIDYSDSPEDQKEDDRNGSPECETSFKAFHLLHSLSDLMMLPFEMLADNSQRKEVCPAFGVPLIKRVLNNFVPDEFCPGPIPDAILETLNTEDVQDDEGCISSIPHVAAPTSYAPPPATSVTGIVQEMGTQSLRRSGSSMVKKSYTSDDELDDLESPLSAIGIDEPSLVSNKFPTVKEGRNFVRYELLREVWRDSE